MKAQHRAEHISKQTVRKEKAQEPETESPASTASWEKQRNPPKIYFCFINYAKAFDCVDHNKLENCYR